MHKVSKNPAAVALGKRGGLKRSRAKTTAARVNGCKGGRPRMLSLALDQADQFWLRVNAPNGLKALVCLAQSSNEGIVRKALISVLNAQK